MNIAHRATVFAVGSLAVLLADVGAGTALLGLVAAVAGALAGVVVNARKLSGKVSTTEATDLWKAQEDIRADYRTQVAALRADLAAAVGELSEARQRIRELDDLVTYLRTGGKDR